MSYFTSKDKNSSRQLTGEKTIWYNVLHEKMIYTDIGYTSILADKWQKDTKDKEATLI